MKRKRGRRQIERFADGAGGHALRPGLNQQPEDGEPRFLRQGRKRLEGLLRFHISRIVEMTLVVKPYRRAGISIRTVKAATPRAPVTASDPVP